MPEKLMDDLKRDLMRALTALYIQVPESVARDVQRIVLAYTEKLEAENQRLREQLRDFPMTTTPEPPEEWDELPPADEPSKVE